MDSIRYWKQYALARHSTWVENDPTPPSWSRWGVFSGYAFIWFLASAFLTSEKQEILPWVFLIPVLGAAVHVYRVRRTGIWANLTPKTVSDFLVRVGLSPRSKFFGLGGTTARIALPPMCVGCGGECSGKTPFTGSYQQGRTTYSYTFDFPICEACDEFSISSYIKYTAMNSASITFKLKNHEYGSALHNSNISFTSGFCAEYICGQCGVAVKENEARCPKCDIKMPERIAKEW